MAMPQMNAAPPELIDVTLVDGNLVVDMAYRGAKNFLGRRVAGYRASANCYLKPGAARALSFANTQLQKSGVYLVMRDCWRPVSGSRDMLQWAYAQDKSNVRNKITRDRMSDLQKFYFQDSVLFDARGILRPSLLLSNSYLSGGTSRHNVGSTVDVELYTNEGHPADTGTAFDVFSKRSAFHARVSAEARKNRNLLRSAMSAQGFRGLSSEWWHWTHRTSDSGPALDGTVD